MNAETSPVNNKNKLYIKSSTLILLAFATAFFSRLLDTAGVPAAVNFLHFATVPTACSFVLLKTQAKNRSQISISKEILFGLFILLTVCFASALINSTGAVNAVLNFLLLTEPFMLLLALISIPMSSTSIKQFQSWLIRFVFFHLFLVYVQMFVLRLYRLPGENDNIQGIFYRSGAGHVVGASVSCTFAVYYFIAAKTHPLWLRVLVLIAGFGNILTSDAKQVLLAFIVAFTLLSLANLKDIRKVFLYVIATIVFVMAFTWAMENLQAFSAFKTWIRPEIYGMDGEATKLKSSGIRIILSYYHSPFNWLVGLGPGHTIGRLGGWMIRDYSNLLLPLGATISPVGNDVWAYVTSSWLAEGSSMFSPFWGWAGIWGDLGFLGLGAYLYLGSLVWRRLCLDDLSKFLVLTVFVFGLIFTQMEEPGYMLFVAILIGLQWQERRKSIKNHL